ncbi:Uncharacterized protein FWK35_00029169 [Aphis craccivora]|uniref:Uncharacterized protein n=1 Tax=Aphis craccivora TaxID=307492 RepID=A0A6G0ZNB9_APHCR|nr:Uncharacterized protein FWK35_00029169 [Aphis craccivora]
MSKLYKSALNPHKSRHNPRLLSRRLVGNFGISDKCLPYIQLSLYDRNREQIYHFRDGKKEKIFEVSEKKSFIIECRHLVNDGRWSSRKVALLWRGWPYSGGAGTDKRSGQIGRRRLRRVGRTRSPPVSVSCANASAAVKRARAPHDDTHTDAAVHAHAVENTHTDAGAFPTPTLRGGGGARGNRRRRRRRSQSLAASFSRTYPFSANAREYTVCAKKAHLPLVVCTSLRHRSCESPTAPPLPSPLPGLTTTATDTTAICFRRCPVRKPREPFKQQQQQQQQH